MSHTSTQVGSRKESIPPDTWTESGRTPVLPESSSSRESAHYVALLPRSEGAIVGSDTGRPLIDGETLRPVTGHDGSLVLEHARVFDAPTEQGFRLFTDPTELGPAWVHNARDPDRLRVGGSLRFTMQPPKGEAFPLSGEFLEIQPPSKIRFTFR